MKIFTRILNIGFYTIFVGMLVGIAGLLLASMLPIPGQIEIKIVKSGSMEPSIPTGSIIVVQPMQKYNVGDVITFGLDTKEEIPTTHRITDIRLENGVEMIQTKGDANEEADSKLTAKSEIIGLVRFHAPYVGFIIDFARQPLGFALLIAIPTGLVILEEVIVIVMEMRKMWRKKKDDEDDSYMAKSYPEEPDAVRIQAVRRRKMDEIIVPRVVEVMYYSRSVAQGSVQAIRYGLMSVLVAYLAVGSLSLLGGPATTLAYFSDIETSIGNYFRAGQWADPADPQNIVLNEFLPNPDTSANGMNWGTDSSDKPLGEWIELYNNGTVPIDVKGWYMKDASGGVGNTHAVISATSTNLGTTIIAPSGWLVVYLNKASLNNTGDSIYLYTSTSTGSILIDSYTYDNPSDFCELEPTPGSTNSTSTPSGTPGGSKAPCSSTTVAPNKSYARIPDGTGAFVDPIPTPGSENIPEPEPAPAQSGSAAPEAENTETPDGGDNPTEGEPIEAPSETPAQGDSSEPAGETPDEPAGEIAEEGAGQMVGNDPQSGSDGATESPAPEPSPEPTPEPPPAPEPEQAPAPEAPPAPTE